MPMSLAAAIDQGTIEGSRERWSARKKIAFQFCFSYFGLYSLCGMVQAVIPIPKVEIPDPGTLWPFRQVIFWVAAHVFHAKLPLVFSDSGSGDKTFDWTEALCILMAAVLITVVWAVLDRR